MDCNSLIPSSNLGVASTIIDAPIAQLDRVSDYESEGREFESLPARQKSHICQRQVWLFLRNKSLQIREIRLACEILLRNVKCAEAREIYFVSLDATHQILQ